jgi:hypothetical protein
MSESEHAVIRRSFAPSGAHALYNQAGIDALFQTGGDFFFSDGSQRCCPPCNNLSSVGAKDNSQTKGLAPAAYPSWGATDAPRFQGK